MYPDLSAETIEKFQAAKTAKDKPAGEVSVEDRTQYDAALKQALTSFHEVCALIRADASLYAAHSTKKNDYHNQQLAIFSVKGCCSTSKHGYLGSSIGGKKTYAEEVAEKVEKIKAEISKEVEIISAIKSRINNLKELAGTIRQAWSNEAKFEVRGEMRAINAIVRIVGSSDDAPELGAEFAQLETPASWMSNSFGLANASLFSGKAKEEAKEEAKEDMGHTAKEEHVDDVDSDAGPAHGNAV